MKHLITLLILATVGLTTLSMASPSEAGAAILADPDKEAAAAGFSHIVGISKSEGNKATEVIIAINHKAPVQVGTKLTVKLRHYIQGRAMYRKIGEMQVTEFVSREQAKCKVTKNKEDVYSYFNESPDDLFAERIIKSKRRW